jgi:integrase
MRAAVDAGVIAKSPCDGVKLPPESRRQMRFLSATDVARLAGAVGPDYSTLVFTAAFTGLRWGELVGLKVERLNLLRRSLTVVEQLNEVNGSLYWGPPKTAAGRRSVSLPSTFVAMLDDHIRQPEVVRSGLVFPTLLGEPMRRSNFARRVWAPATKEIGQDGLRFHDLRHTAVALAIEQGAHPKAIQERLGHSSVMVTLDRYGHLFEGLDAELADGLDAELRNSRGLAAAWGPEGTRERERETR